MMDRDDLLDLLAIVAATDNRTIGQTDVAIWMELIGDLPKDDCLAAIEGHRKEQPGVWLEPGHIVQRVKAMRRDRFDRLDPNTRESAWADLGGGQPRPQQRAFGGGYVDARGKRRDRFGHLDLSAPDLEYPAEWTGEQRRKAYWEHVRSGFSSVPAPDPNPVEHPPGRPCIGRGCDKPSTFGDFCAQHYVLYGAWSKNGPRGVPAQSLSQLFERTADEVLDE